MECKRSQRVDGEKVVLALARKIDKFPWEFDRIERMVFARSFSSKVEGCFDLDDIYGWTASPPRTQD